MCNTACNEFVARWLDPDEITDKDVLEVGARDVNGSVRPLIEKHKPNRYVGVDIEKGKRVDYVCDAVNLVEEFGAASFDMLVSTEMLEHVPDWRAVVSNFKRVLRPGGVLYLTTRSPGFPYHGYPADFWRFTTEDMEAIFSEFEIVTVEGDPSEPGVFVKARKPRRRKFVETDLSDYHVQNVEGQVAQAVKQDIPTAPAIPPRSQERIAQPPPQPQAPQAVNAPPVVQPLPVNYRRLPWDRRAK